MGRSNWYYDHPPACNCAKCVADRTRPNRGNWLKRLWRKLVGG